MQTSGADTDTGQDRSAVPFIVRQEPCRAAAISEMPRPGRILQMR
jgi:hypothetical protein